MKYHHEQNIMNKNYICYYLFRFSCIIYILGISFGTEEVGSLTGQVGTALYVAPELTTKAAKAIYNQKVDIYSLGVILFEMCYKSLTTGMERIKILLNLRSKEIIFPSEMQQADMSRQIHILRYNKNYIYNKNSLLILC